ncbi:hypothetical protein U5640_43755 [Streptomyces sp. SS7]|uniref:hypothetical protein n=1 Tax=Streptomyces sp. SS7 TaxID=3108485 RepID=UPI0030EB9B5B
MNRARSWRRCARAGTAPLHALLPGKRPLAAAGQGIPAHGTHGSPAGTTTAVT